LLTNGNRLARTIMTLEALLGHEERPPVQRLLEPFLRAGSVSLAEAADALSEYREPRTLPPIRAAQRQLARALAGSGAAELVAACDRLVDNANTLTHIVARAPAHPPAAARA
jgi:hypothetical protein